MLVPETIEFSDLEKWQPHDRATIWYRWSALGDAAERIEGDTDTEGA